MNPGTKLIIAATLGVVGFVAIWFVAMNPWMPADWEARFSGDAKRAASERLGRLEGEIARLGSSHTWAGSYSKGDGLSPESLSLAPDAGFVYEAHSCGGLSDRNYGEVRSTSDGLVLIPTFSMTRYGVSLLASPLVPIAWGDRRYLVPSDRLERFCEDVNSGWEARSETHGSYLLRLGDEEKPAPGLPEVPEKVRPLLRDTPLIAQVTHVGSEWIDNEGFRHRSVTLDVGASQSVRKGLEMELLDPKHYLHIVIDKVGTNTSEAHTGGYKDPTQLEVGWKFTSKIWDSPR